MRYELSTYEWSVIRPMLPNKARGVPRIDGRRIINGIASALTITGRETWPGDSFNRISQCRRKRRAGGRCSQDRDLGPHLVTICGPSRRVLSSISLNRLGLLNRPVLHVFFSRIARS